MSIWIAVGLIFAVCFLAVLMVLLNVVVRMRKENYQIPYVKAHMDRDRGDLGSSGDLSWERYKDASLSRRSNSSIDQTWSLRPASIAGVTRSVLCTLQKL
jgi:hypothetical protein